MKISNAAISPETNDFLKYYNCYFAKPHNLIEHSVSTTSKHIGIVVVKFIGLTYGFWWEIIIAIVYWFLMELISKSFNISLLGIHWNCSTYMVIISKIN